MCVMECCITALLLPGKLVGKLAGTVALAYTLQTVMGSETSTVTVCTGLGAAVGELITTELPLFAAGRVVGKPGAMEVPLFAAGRVVEKPRAMEDPLFTTGRVVGCNVTVVTWPEAVLVITSVVKFESGVVAEAVALPMYTDDSTGLAACNSSQYAGNRHYAMAYHSCIDSSSSGNKGDERCRELHANEIIVTGLRESQAMQLSNDKKNA